MESGRAPSLTNGQLAFDRYRLKALVGRGAMGAIWRAFDQELETDIALKFLGEEFLFDPAALTALKSETRRGMALSHPHILRIYGFFQGGGQAAIAMEMVEGNSLASLQASHLPRCFDPAELGEWVRQLCSALHYAHNEEHLVHRDLKPGNLMVDDRGRLKVADFGIAARLNFARSSLANAPAQTEATGTPGYMSPQQLLGQKPGVEHDIYSLGATLYDLLTGRPPFHTGDISLQVRTVTPPPVAERRAENGFTGGPIPPEWEETIAACLAKDASLRPASAAQVAERLGLGGPGPTGTGGGARGPHSTGSTPPHSAASAPTVLRPAVASARSPARPARRAALIALLAGGLALAGYFALRPTASPPAPSASLPKPGAAAATAEANSVAVLAFTNMSPDRDTEYFSDGVSEEILNTLANNPALRVAGRTSSFSFKGKNATNREIGQALNVASVIEGSVRRAGNTVRITVQLVNVADGYHVWSETFDREMTDLFAVQSEIAAKVAQKLSGSPAPEQPVPMAAAPTRNLAAYDAYLRGRAAQRSGFSFKLIAEAQKHLEEAVRLDPDYALAWARLTELFVRIWADSFDRSPALANKARQAAARSLRLRPELPEAHLAQALLAEALDTDPQTARSELDQVELLRPNDPELPAARARLARTRGARDETVVTLALRAVEADPQNSDTLALMATILTTCGHFAEAERLCERAWSVSQVSEQPILANVGNLVTWTGDTKAALALLETVPEALREPRFFRSRADLLQHLERLDEACADYGESRSRVLANDQLRLRSGPRSNAITSHFYLAGVEARQGHTEQAATRYAAVLAEIDDYVHDFPDLPSGYTARAWIHAVLGHRAEAFAALGEAERLAQTLPDALANLELIRVSRGTVLGALGDADAAVAELRALHEAGVVFGYTLRIAPNFGPLRANAKFQQLMKDAEARVEAQPRPKK